MRTTISLRLVMVAAFLSLLADRSYADPVVTVNNNSILTAHAGDASGPTQSFNSAANPFNQTADVSIDNGSVQTATMSLSLTGGTFHVFGDSSGVTSVNTLNSAGPFASANTSFNLILNLDQPYYFQWSGSATASGDSADSAVELINEHFDGATFLYHAFSPTTGASSGSESGVLVADNGNGYYEITGFSEISGNSSSAFTFDLVLSATPIPESSTCVAIFGAVALGAAGVREHRRRKLAA